MKRFIPKTLELVSLFLLLMGSAQGETMVLTFQEGTSGYVGNTDATMYEENPTFSNGANDEYQVGVTGPLTGFPQGARRRAAIRFDLTSIPAGGIVTGVTLELILSGASSGGPSTVNNTVHPLLKEWGEGTVNTPSQGGPGNPGDMTWSSNKLGSELWTNPGGDAGWGLTVEEVGNSGKVAWSSGPGEYMVVMVNQWLSDPASNFGLLLVGDERATLRTGRRYHSSEATLAANRPKLLIKVEVQNSGVQGWSLY
jgi:hypothetical protein